MNAIDTIQEIMKNTGTTLSDLVEYSELGTKQNIHQMLSRNDLKVSTFVSMLETMGYQLVVQHTENENEEIVIDY